jgi:hypothetical protein
VSSLRKLYANWLNARFSTGPRTAAGKARAAQNARKHGLRVPALPIRQWPRTSARWRASSPARMRMRSASRPRAGSSPRRSISWISGRRAFLCFPVCWSMTPRSIGSRRLISMSALRAHGGSPRPGSSAPYVLQWPQTAGKQSVMTPAATRSTLRPCCGSCLQRKLRGYRESAATAPRAELTCGQGGDLM